MPRSRSQIRFCRLHRDSKKRRGGADCTGSPPPTRSDLPDAEGPWSRFQRGLRRRGQHNHGDIVAAMLDGEATVKRLRRESGRVWLMPHNSAYEPIPGEEATILGKVVTVPRLPLSWRRNCF
ncbi:LexA family protein [Streptomyces atroolivaceus]|uniref:LexA family protein n=1 Tax=Streptomyces atroolivaceus TaxID=66869 RepID=UPI00365B3B32